MPLSLPIACLNPTCCPLKVRTRVCAPSLGGSAKRSYVVCAQQKTQPETKIDGGVLPVVPLPCIRRRNFPSDFVFGAAASAYQFEGAANIHGKGPSIWDTYTHKFPERIADRSNGDVAANSYHRYMEDVQCLVELGMDAYRFSISWSRILPNGRGRVNKEGIQYYNNLIDELLAKGIQPYPTLFHWDLPQALEDEYGGLLGDRIVKDFKNFAEVCFREFGDRVKHWTTLNEPYTLATYGYGLGGLAPGRCSQNVDAGNGLVLNCPAGDSLREPYFVAHNLLRAHAEAVHLYRQKYQARQNGQIGIALNCHWMEPFDDSGPSNDAHERALQFMLGWFLDPVKFGDYPLWMRALVRERLPFFTPEETKKLKNSYDFVGINYYTARYARDQPITPGFQPVTHLDDARVDIRIDGNIGVPIGPAEPGSWVNVYPRGLREILLYMKSRYDNPPIYITENGVMEIDHKIPLKQTLEEPLRVLKDKHRSAYLALHLAELREALRHGVDVKGYFTWSLLDNFEWSSGYSSRFGLYFVDYYKTLNPWDKMLPDLRRIPKQSVYWFKRFLERTPIVEPNQEASSIVEPYQEASSIVE